MPIDLEQLGWDGAFASALDAAGAPGLTPARVAIEHNHLYRVYTRDGELLAEASGSLRHAAAGPDGLPAVGDWVAIRVGGKRAAIHAILPRRSCFARKAAGDPTQRQVVAANVDTVLLVSGLDGDFNPRRVERYLVAAAESGAAPVVVLNKADLCPSAADAVETIRAIAPRVPVHATSCAQPTGLDQLRAYLVPGRTVALLGSSGTGKSSIINHLLGSERQQTRRVHRRTSRGRHTTVHRELMLRPDGGVIIDTPGMRELRLWDTGQALEATFDDVDALAGDCRFRDCRHRSEPGCAVREAVAAGRLPAARLDHFRRLEIERTVLQERQQQLSRMTEARQDQPSRPAARSSRRLSQ
ncbi:MAG: ribosome small subunit-dependent GTPase A [Acidobacteria bacterium]|nr:ribosome small subunit-dependent GTPase A [Acidobacteriota bacterium]